MYIVQVKQCSKMRSNSNKYRVVDVPVVSLYKHWVAQLIIKVCTYCTDFQYQYDFLFLSDKARISLLKVMFTLHLNISVNVCPCTGYKPCNSVLGEQVFLWFYLHWLQDSYCVKKLAKFNLITSLTFVYCYHLIQRII